VADDRREDGALSAPAAAGDGAAIVARGVQRRFGAHRVLRGLDLDVGAGTTVVVFGPNGAGKTTLLRILTGISRPTAGSVHVLGTELPGDAALRARIGVVGHEPFVYGDLTARENLSYYARLYRVADASRVDAVLAAVELPAAAARPVHTYSRGMLQRLSLARAVLHEPDVLLLDEPFTGLDPHGASRFASMLEGLRDEHVTVLLTTHDFARGLAVADRAVLLHAGRLAWDSGTDLPDTSAMHEIYSRTVSPAGG